MKAKFDDKTRLMAIVANKAAEEIMCNLVWGHKFCARNFQYCCTDLIEIDGNCFRYQGDIEVTVHMINVGKKYSNWKVTDVDVSYYRRNVIGVKVSAEINENWDKTKLEKLRKLRSWNTPMIQGSAGVQGSLFKY